jgi:tetratricopeptide (TPR) repeat protein
MPNPALVFRSLALFAVLCQFRLIAADLADTPFFITTLFAAFAAAGFLSRPGFYGKKTGPLGTLVTIALAPWIARAFIALPRLFIPGRTDAAAVRLDSLLLDLDRNNFVSLFPFYWAAATSWFSIRSRKFLRASVIADAVLLVVVFSIAHTANIELYRWPVVMIAVFAGIVFLQTLALLFSPSLETGPQKSEVIPAAAALLALIALGGILFLRPSQERAVEKGGGLLEPKFFNFDFSRFLRLDSEISMNDDLVLIVKKDSDDNHILLRRSVLSGYSKGQGFYRIEELDERTHPQRLPNHPARFSPAEFKTSRKVNQEYFLVNFDTSAFIGMNVPVSVTPYESWDASSFNSAYAVESIRSDSDVGEWEIYRSVHDWPGAAELGLSETEFKIYTDYGGDERLRAYAGEITRGLDRYGDKVQMILETLKYGEYRYSLKPGIAPDGDQLSWFLFQSKKGYCSYYAFAMALLLRSLGIPARVAAGFFIDPATNAFDYYPVRSDMAHAWVEVPFPGYGWVEYDPTTENLAEGEDFRFSAGVDPNLFERLMREILENRSRLRVREGQDTENDRPGFGSLARSAAKLLRDYSLPILPALIAALFLYIRCGCRLAAALCRDRRGQTIRLWKHTLRRLRLAGLRRNAALSESDWALHIDKRITGTYTLYRGYAAARFAPGYSDDDFGLQWSAYREFSAAYGRVVSPGRRLLAWLLPPLALLAGPGNGGGALILLLALLVPAGSKAAAQDGEERTFSAADELYMDATEAEFAEFWERAINLFKEGSARYPDDPRFPWALGNLYYSHSLYGLAWEEYRRAEMISPLEPSLLYRLAGTAGYLNRDEISVDYYERLLGIDPDNKDAISSLGWMYYKVHRLGDGERLLKDALERFGDDADLAMTLGTVYSDMYNYDAGRYWYDKAITLGKAVGDRVFTAVAWYNLSILESRFYRHDLSMDATNASLNAQNRASGRLARGELYLHQMELERAQQDYEAAYETDTSPLAMLNLAQVYQISGRLEEARRYAEECLKTSDHSWMLHYGIDPDRYRRDTHEILYKTYRGMAETERFLPQGKIIEKIFSFFRRVLYRFQSAVHAALYRKYSLAAAAAYGAEIYEGGGPHLDSFVQYYNAFESYPSRASTYLSRARDFESSLIPAAEPSYILEEGLLLKDAALLEQALAGLDPLWEKEMISQCWRELARQGRKDAAAELFAVNRGAPRQAGIALPVEITVDTTGVDNVPDSRKGRARMIKALAGAGFKPADTARFRLDIALRGSAASGYTASCDLSDTAGEIDSLRYSIPLRSFSGVDTAGFARALGNMVFRVP